MANIDLGKLTNVEEDALALTSAAIQIDQARAKGGGELTAALDQNLQLWVAIKSLMQSPDCKMPKQSRDNLISLSQFVAQKTFEIAEGVTDDTLNSLININLQISEGLLENKKA
jgi:flagellar protein FlaF